MRHAIGPVLIFASLWVCSIGCAPTANGIWRPALPWTRGAIARTAPTRTPADSLGTNPWTQPDLDPTALPRVTEQPRLAGARDGLNLPFLDDLMKRADAQESLAERQRRQLEQLKILQRKQQEEERQYIIAQRKKERDELARQYREKEQLLAEREKMSRGRVDQLQGRASSLDDNNRELTAQLARSEQRSQVLEDEIDLLKNQLAETARLLTQTRNVGRETGQRLQALQASASQRRGGASITANSSLKRAVTARTVPGMDIRQDDDLVRISIPTDRLFMTGTAQLHQGSRAYLDQIVTVISQYYPRQRIGVEAHTDHSSSHQAANSQWESQHQMTAAQALKIFDQLTSRGMSPHQLFVLGHGGNHPIASDGTAQGQAMNRRVEIVVYPDTYAR